MKELRHLIDLAKTKALFSNQVLKIIKGKANLLLYHQLKKYNNIDDALGKYGALILLYETRKNFGHWTCIFKRKSYFSDDTVIEHFDSYGIMPDDELKFTEKYMRQINSEILPHLTALLYKSGYPIEYNNYQLQERKKGISTCGRWVGMRLFFRDLPIEDFIKIFIGNRIYNPDDIVTLLTYII